jgi:hypothetical protein
MFTKEYWAKYRAEKAAGKPVKLAGHKRGKKGYPAEVKSGEITKEQVLKKTLEDKIYLLGSAAHTFLKKTLKEGMEEPEVDDKGNLNFDKQKMALTAAKYVADKIVPDKVAEKKTGGAKSADDLRSDILRLFRDLKNPSRVTVGISVQTNREGNVRVAENSGCEIHTRVESIDGGASGLERPETDRLLRTGGDTSGELPQKLKDPQGSTGVEQQR